VKSVSCVVIENLLLPLRIMSATDSPVIHTITEMDEAARQIIREANQVHTPVDADETAASRLAAPPGFEQGAGRAAPEEEEAELSAAGDLTGISGHPAPFVIESAVEERPEGMVVAGAEALDDTIPGDVGGVLEGGEPSDEPVVARLEGRSPSLIAGTTGEEEPATEEEPDVQEVDATGAVLLGTAGLLLLQPKKEPDVGKPALVAALVPSLRAEEVVEVIVEVDGVAVESDSEPGEDSDIEAPQKEVPGPVAVVLGEEAGTVTPKPRGRSRKRRASGTPGSAQKRSRTQKADASHHSTSDEDAEVDVVGDADPMEDDHSSTESGDFIIRIEHPTSGPSVLKTRLTEADQDSLTAGKVVTRFMPAHTGPLCITLSTGLITRLG
jgi:hypothetical protein